MKYYLLAELERIRVPDIQNYNQVINYRAFEEDKAYEMNKRTVCVVNNDADFGDILFTPFPLFSERAKEALDLFFWDSTYKEFDFLTCDRSASFHYYLPFFWRTPGTCSIKEASSGMKTAEVILNHAIPEDIPAIYLNTGTTLLMIARLDLVESLLRKGACSVQMYPVSLKL